MVSNARAVDALIDIAASWKGSIRFVSKDEFWDLTNNQDGWCTPYPPDNDGHALHYETKQIVVVRHLVNAGALIHEMGHVFADPFDPDHAEEWAWFGWEVCLAHMVNCYPIWSRSTREYYVEYPPENGATWGWGSLRARQKMKIITNRIETAIEAGIVDKYQIPLTIR
jgi:hypothetical protein